MAHGDVYIIDFEGEPAKPLEQRRAKTSRLRDVAGMLRSFDYAAAVTEAQERRHQAHVADPQRDAFLRTFVEGAAQCFLAAYAEVVAGRGCRGGTDDLLRLFLIEKAAYEIGYEAANRPAWIDVPLHGLAQLVAQVTGMNDVTEVTRRCRRAWRRRSPSARLGDPFGVLGPHDDRDGPDRPRLPAGRRASRCWPRDRRQLLGRLAPTHAARSVRGPRQQQPTVSAAYRLAGGGAGNRRSIFLRAAARRTRSASVQRRQAFRTGVASRRQRDDASDGVTGVRFAVWAPNARAVSVVGDFNTWDPRRNPMRLRFPSGVWELFIPRLAPGARYKYRHRRSGRRTSAAQGRSAGASDRGAAGHRLGRRRSHAACLARRDVDAATRGPPCHRRTDLDL